MWGWGCCTGAATGLVGHLAATVLLLCYKISLFSHFWGSLPAAHSPRTCNASNTPKIPVSIRVMRETLPSSPHVRRCLHVPPIPKTPGDSTCPYPPSQDLVDGCALLQRAFSDDLRPHLFHIQHESIQGLLDSGLLGFLLSLWFWLRFPWQGQKEQSVSEPRGVTE